MENQIKKSKSPIILGVISCIAWFFPLIGLIISIVGIIMSSKKIKEFSCKAYKIALALNIIGLVLTIINSIAGMIMVYHKLMV
ncbi:hypothetical protein LTX14_002684 [Clostridium perfringens]|uniref:hypothetical protein n=1 Tax=Clostridium perfringens TaxID=1502 RepID=UPI000F533E93|nr:hypothetical protein [Clostridium perfringens]EGT4137700.1 hypothetical protein [Clostridium perfringens]EIW6615301.1 hypothetical protein [Clostridium perfringens]EJT6342107.1 hypothetical protein [Clostridium perfringens]ELQ0173124.1 hypothetical protein [Clostridium perfringens]MDM0609131.1 hypothetical protein [Clostridium perfringens]